MMKMNTKRDIEKEDVDADDDLAFRQDTFFWLLE